MYKKILVPIDLGRPKNAARLCQAVRALADEDTEVRLFSVVPGYGMSVVASFFPSDAQDKAKVQVKAGLKALAQEQQLIGKLSYSVSEGRRATGILNEATSWQPELITLASRRKISRDGQRVLGSCSSSVADRASCSVLIVR